MNWPPDSRLPPALRAQCSIGRVIEAPKGQPEAGQRERILLAATRLFGERGYRRVTSDDLAAAANLSVGTIYTYFGDKRDCLLAAFLHRAAAELASGGRRQRDRSPAFQRALLDGLASRILAAVEEGARLAELGPGLSEIYLLASDTSVPTA
jgi:AcrR family transcriptional regulator